MTSGSSWRAWFRWFIPVLYLCFLGYLLVVPLVLVLYFYLNVLQCVVSIMFALGLPMGLYHFLWKAEVANERQRRTQERQESAREQQMAAAAADAASAGAAAVGGDNVLSRHERARSHSSVLSRAHRRRVSAMGHRVDAASASLSDIFSTVSKHYVYELYQLLLTLLSCATYIFYTYHLRFHYTPAVYDAHTGVEVSSAQSDYSLTFESGSTSGGGADEEFVQVEYFLMVSLSVDYLLRLHSTPRERQWRYLCSFYSLLDLACFSAVAYGAFWHRQLAPKDTTFNLYLLQAPFRLLRLRRALQSLDKPVRMLAEQHPAGAAAANAAQSEEEALPTLALFRLGPLTLSRRTAFLVLLVLRVVLFICSAAALVLALEFPCEALKPPDDRTNNSCSPDLQRFHVALYFLIVTLSTCGYGDVACVTDLGRCLMSAIIVWAVVSVPREAQAFADLDAEERRAEKEQKDKATQGKVARAAAEAATAAVVAVAAGMQTPAKGAAAAALSAAGGGGSAFSFPAAAASSSGIHVSGGGSLSNTGGGLFGGGGGGSGGISAPVLSAFLADDQVLLRRWAAGQLAQTCAHRPGLLQALLQATGADPDAAAVMAHLPQQQQQQQQQATQQHCARLVHVLFGDSGAGEEVLAHKFAASSHAAAASFFAPESASTSAAASSRTGGSLQWE